MESSSTCNRKGRFGTRSFSKAQREKKKERERELRVHILAKLGDCIERYGIDSSI